MSSLLQCTDELLQQKAVQSSHYERLEQQLLDRERRRRAVAMNLKVRIADVERRGNDVVDLRHEVVQLTSRLAQHSLQLAALQCRSSEAQKAQRAVVERLQDGVRSWSGHPAQIVWVVQALQEQKRLTISARELARVLGGVADALRLHRQVGSFHRHCVMLLRWHTENTTRCRAQLHDAAQAAERNRDDALRRAAETTAELDGPLRQHYQEMERRHLCLQAEQAQLCHYEEIVEARCITAREAVVALSLQMDQKSALLSEAEAAAAQAGVELTDATNALAHQRQAHADAAAAISQSLQKATAEKAAVESAVASMKEENNQLKEQSDALRERVVGVTQCALTASFLSDLLDCVRRHCQRERAEQSEQQAAAERELTQLRLQHAQSLRERQMARAEAAFRQQSAALVQQEGQLRKAATDLEADEWRLLHAQLVRDACRARAAAAAALAEAAKKKKLSVLQSEKAKAVTGTDGASARSGPAKRPRESDQQSQPPPQRARGSAASRRQRAALEAVDALTLTASQGSRTRDVGRTAAPATTTTPLPNSFAKAKASCGGAGGGKAGQQSPSTISSHPRAAYKLVSLKPSTAKKTAAMEEGTRGGPHGGVAAVMSPYVATNGGSDSDSSFSLMNAGGYTDAAADAAAQTERNTAASRFRGKTVAEVRVSSPSYSPPPRRPTAAGGGKVPLPYALPRTRPALPTDTPAKGRDNTHVIAETVVEPNTPRSALDSALLAARTPRPAGVVVTSPVSYKVSAAAGNAAALPAGLARGRLTGIVQPQPPLPMRPTAAPTSGLAASPAGVRRRAPPLMATSAGAADDLFADLFS